MGRTIRRYSSNQNNSDKGGTNRSDQLTMYSMLLPMECHQHLHLIRHLQGQCYRGLSKTYKELKVLNSCLCYLPTTKQLIRISQNLNTEIRAWRPKWIMIFKPSKRRCLPKNYIRVLTNCHQDSLQPHDVKSVLNPLEMQAQSSKQRQPLPHSMRNRITSSSARSTAIWSRTFRVKLSRLSHRKQWRISWKHHRLCRC